MPYSTTNITIALGQAFKNYNNAYISYHMAQVTYNLVNVLADGAYFVLENLTSDLITLIF